VIAVQARANADVRAANKREREKFELAVQAIATFHTGVSEDFLLKEERFKSVRDRLLKAANDFYAKLAALLSKESDPSSRGALGQANFEAAVLTSKVGQKEAALAAHQQVLKYREGLAADPDASPALKIDLSRSLTSVAGLLCSTGQTDSGLATFRRAEETLAAVKSSDPTAVQDALAQCRVAHGNSLLVGGRHNEGLAVLRTGRAELESRAAVQRLSTEAQGQLARAVLLIASELRRMGQYAESEVDMRAAIAMQQNLAEDPREGASYRSGLAQTHANLAYLLRQLGRPREALAEYRLALAILQRVIDDQPAAIDLRVLEAFYHREIGRLLVDLGHRSVGYAELHSARAIEQKLADEQPAYTQCRESLAATHHAIGLWLARDGQPARALESYRAALAIHEKLMQQHPGNPEHREDFANDANDAAGALAKLGQTREARALCERALAINEALLRADAKSPLYSYLVAESLMRMGQVRRAQGDTAGAAEDWHWSASIYAARPQKDWEVRFFEACCRAGLAGLGGVPGSGVSTTEGIAEAETAMTNLRQALALGLTNFAWLRTESLLNPLRGRIDFQTLLTDLAMPADPFAS
jgi:tetratricopeptide (TPR) repeat protein